MNLKAFYDSVRKSGVINLTVQNVPGFDRILKYGESIHEPLGSVSYKIATAYWETGASMRPVEEGYYLGSESRVKAFQRKLRYYPFFGRGLVQTTWETNYRKLAVLLGLPETFFVKNPEKLLTWEYALPALFKALDVGLYTGKSVDDYIDNIDESDDEDYREYLNARRTVNGTDKAATIAKIALAVEHGLTAAGYDPAGSKPVAPPPASKPTTSTAEPAAAQPSGLMQVIRALLKLLGVI